METQLKTKMGEAKLNMMEKSQRVIQVSLPILILLGATKLLSIITRIPVRQFMIDPNEIMHAPFYIGIISNFDVLLWAAAASICLFMSTFLGQWLSKEWRNFFLVSGLLTLLLLLDDLLRIHDEILPVYLGIKGDFVGIVYVLLVLLYLFRFHRLIFQHTYGFLVMSLGFFAVSAAVDVAPTALKHRFLQEDIVLLEDGAKLLGTAYWLAYFAYLSTSVFSKANLVLPKLPVDNQTQRATSD